jgi:hypothetical protein
MNSFGGNRTGSVKSIGAGEGHKNARPAPETKAGATGAHCGSAEGQVGAGKENCKQASEEGHEESSCKSR